MRGRPRRDLHRYLRISLPWHHGVEIPPPHRRHVADKIVGSTTDIALRKPHRDHRHRGPATGCCPELAAGPDRIRNHLSAHTPYPDIRADARWCVPAE